MGGAAKWQQGNNENGDLPKMLEMSLNILIN